MTDQHISDESDLRKYRTELPNIIDDLGLDPYQRALYCHYKRVCGGNNGTCTEGIRTTSESTKMSTAKVSLARRELVEKGLIVVREVGQYIHVKIIDLWEINFAYFSIKNRPEIDGWTVEQVRDFTISVYEVNTYGKVSDEINAESVYEVNSNGESVYEVNGKGQKCLPHKTKKEHVTKNKQKNNDNDKEKNNDISSEQQSVKSASQAMFSALADLCGYDLGLMTNETRDALNQAEKKMRDNKYTPEDVTAFGEWWYSYDWRGKEKQPPTLAQIRETWGRFRAWQKEKTEQAPAPAPADQAPVAPVPVYVQTWVNAQSLMQGQMTKATFDAWVRDCEAQPNTNGTFILKAKSPEAKDWIDNRLSNIFLKALKSVKPDISKLEVIVR